MLELVRRERQRRPPLAAEAGRGVAHRWPQAGVDEPLGPWVSPEAPAAARQEGAEAAAATVSGGVVQRAMAATHIVTRGCDTALHWAAVRGACCPDRAGGHVRSGPAAPPPPPSRSIHHCSPHRHPSMPTRHGGAGVNDRQTPCPAGVPPAHCRLHMPSLAAPVPPRAGVHPLCPCAPATQHDPQCAAPPATLSCAPPDNPSTRAQEQAKASTASGPKPGGLPAPMGLGKQPCRSPCKFVPAPCQKEKNSSPAHERV